MASYPLTATRTTAVGPELQTGGVHFRVWAPKRKTVEVVFPSGATPVGLTPEGNGYFSGLAEMVKAGDLYKFRLDGADAYPDPASRFQPTGPHGFSEVVSADFAWSDQEWGGCLLRGQVIYEMHVGTFTSEGTWRSAAAKLPYLRETGITLLEVMPVADFPGRFGWGYDGVLLYAPVALYGTPDHFRSFVNQAHQLGIAVVLDVVYNHMGPDGNYVTQFSDAYFSQKHETDWGAAINFDGPDCSSVREFVRENAAYWIRDFHLDGLRLDATQDIHDDSSSHILSEISQAARLAAGNRPVVLIGENEPQDTCLLRTCENGGYGLDALWNDDFHHSATVAMTANSDAYYSDYRGEAQEFVSALKYGYLYQGQWYRWQEKRRGTPNWEAPRPSMVTFIQNHDQVANSARGLRANALTSPGKYKAMTALTLLAPGTPMLLQGQEFAASTPFLFFADHKADLAEKVRKGRAEFLAQWRSLSQPDMLGVFADPADPATFEQSKLDFGEVERHRHLYLLHQDLLHLRRTDPVLSSQGDQGLDGAVLSPHCFIIRYFSPGHAEDRLLVVNLGRELERNPAPEPLLAPPAGKLWAVKWSSEDPRYLGNGTPPLDSSQNWRIPGEATVLLYPVAISANSESKN